MANLYGTTNAKRRRLEAGEGAQQIHFTETGPSAEDRSQGLSYLEMVQRHVDRDPLPRNWPPSPPISQSQFPGQGLLFDSWDYVEDRPWAQHPDDWVNRDDVFFHGTEQAHVVAGYVGRSNQEMHLGTRRAAQVRMRSTRRTDKAGAGILALRVDAQDAPPSRVYDEGDPHHPDSERGGALFSVPDAPAFYVNSHEDRGSVSVIAHPDHLRRWSDDVREADAAGHNVGQVARQMAETYPYGVALRKPRKGKGSAKAQEMFPVDVYEYTRGGDYEQKLVGHATDDRRYSDDRARVNEFNAAQGWGPDDDPSWNWHQPDSYETQPAVTGHERFRRMYKRSGRTTAEHAGVPIRQRTQFTELGPVSRPRR